jgi:hypothetical protein
MTGVTRDDIRAAVASGTLSEAQAASLIVLAEERAGVRTHMTGLDEPFELFKGFNEIFIVVGLTILYLGFRRDHGNDDVRHRKRLYPRRDLCPDRDGRRDRAGALLHAETPHGGPVHRAGAIMFGFLAGQFGISVSAMFDLKAPANPDGNGGIAALFLAAYLPVFRVPFTVALVALSVFATVFGLATLGGSFPETPRISSC